MQTQPLTPPWGSHTVLSLCQREIPRQADVPGPSGDLRAARALQTLSLVCIPQNPIHLPLSQCAPLLLGRTLMPNVSCHVHLLRAYTSRVRNQKTQNAPDSSGGWLGHPDPHCPQTFLMNRGMSEATRLSVCSAHLSPQLNLSSLPSGYSSIFDHNKASFYSE